MVVLTDSDPSSPTKSRHTPSPPPVPSSSGLQAQQAQYGSVPHSENPYFVPPPAYVPDANAPLLPGPPQKSPRHSATKRFCSAFSIAVIIFIALSILKSLIGGLRFDPITWGNYPLPEDGSVISCSDSWLEDYTASPLGGTFNQTTIPGYPVFSSSKSYSFPINSSLHYIVTRGGLSSGAVVVRGSENVNRDRIGVEIVVRYHSHRALGRGRICELEKPEGGVGVGIYTPASRIEFGERVEDELSFTVTLTIPISSQSILDLNAFATNTQNFRHNIEGLGDRVRFEHVSLKGSNGAVQINGLSVSRGSIFTSNGKISGKFNATDSLILKTTNGAIETDIGITNDDTHKASDLALETSNGRIASKISLLTTHDQRPQPKGGHFKVCATTSNGRLDIGFPSTPVDSLLDLEAKTSNGPADVSLHAAYEGSYSLASSGGVEIDKEYTKDPSGKGRDRVLLHTITSRRKIEGSVFWGHEWDHDRNAETGRAVISTSNSWARLRLI